MTGTGKAHGRRNAAAIEAAAAAVGASIGRGEPSQVIAERALAAAEPDLAAQEILYLAHVRWPRGEEFGLYRQKQDADACLATRPDALLREVISMEVLGNAADGCGPEVSDPPVVHATATVTCDDRDLHGEADPAACHEQAAAHRQATGHRVLVIEITTTAYTEDEESR